MTCKRPYCNETVLPWLDPDYCGTGCRAAAINAREQQIRGLKVELDRAEHLVGPAEGAIAKALDTGETLQHRNGTWTAINPGGAEHLAVTEPEPIVVDIEPDTTRWETASKWWRRWTRCRP